MRRTGRGGSASRESEGKGGREGGRGVDLWEKKKGTHVHACIGRGERMATSVPPSGTSTYTYM